MNDSQMSSGMKKSTSQTDIHKAKVPLLNLSKDTITALGSLAKEGGELYQKLESYKLESPRKLDSPRGKLDSPRGKLDSPRLKPPTDKKLKVTFSKTNLKNEAT